MTIIVVIIIVPEKYNTIYGYAEVLYNIISSFREEKKILTKKKSVVEHPKINGVRIEFGRIPFRLVVVVVVVVHSFAFPIKRVRVVLLSDFSIADPQNLLWQNVLVVVSDRLCRPPTIR